MPLPYQIRLILRTCKSSPSTGSIGTAMGRGSVGMNPGLLSAGNHQKIIASYSGFLEAVEIEKIRAEARRHTKLMYCLGVEHFVFAKKIAKRQWRQRISRLYYASYNVSKSVRFDNDGNFSTESKDHSKVGSLPAGFPNHAMYENELKNLREDRNSCDYDHLAKLDDLLKSPADYETMVLEFIRHAHDHLSSRGNTLGAKL